MIQAAPDRQALARRGKRLEYFTIAWNILEGLVAVLAGAIAGSISLVGFGVDSFIEVASACAVLWRMSVGDDATERTEKIALAIVGICFLALAAGVAFEAITDLVRMRTPERSVAGIILAFASLIAMPLLARAKRRVAVALGSPAMIADAKQTQFCFYLSAILLAGLLLNAVWELWWADPIAALLMTPIIAKEGVAGLRGDRCCH